jgi:hypothetical protein
MVDWAVKAIATGRSIDALRTDDKECRQAALWSPKGPSDGVSHRRSLLVDRVAPAPCRYFAVVHRERVFSLWSLIQPARP